MEGGDAVKASHSDRSSSSLVWCLTLLPKAQATDIVLGGHFFFPSHSLAKGMG